MGKDRKQKAGELESLERYRTEVLRKVGLESLNETVKTFRDRFDTLTGTEQRDMIEKVIKKIDGPSGQSAGNCCFRNPQRGCHREEQKYGKRTNWRPERHDRPTIKNHWRLQRL